LESLNGGCASEDERAHVKVELPPHLFYESRAVPKTDQSSIIVKKILGNLTINSCHDSSSSTTKATMTMTKVQHGLTLVGTVAVVTTIAMNRTHPGIIAAVWLLQIVSPLASKSADSILYLATY
jgi:hypothetical protein